MQILYYASTDVQSEGRHWTLSGAYLLKRKSYKAGSHISYQLQNVHVDEPAIRTLVDRYSPKQVDSINTHECWHSKEVVL